MRYIQSIEDSKMWKDQLEDTIKGKNKSQGNYYVINQSGRGESTHFIPEVTEDIYRAKARIKSAKSSSKSYKRRNKGSNTHSKRRHRRRKKPVSDKRKKKRKQGRKSNIRRTIGGKIKKRRTRKRRR